MSVQIINFSGKGTEGNYIYSPLSAPRSLDEFELNIIDLSDEKLWYNDDPNSKIDSINSINDFKSVGVMVNGSKTTKIVFVFPQDIDFHFAKSYILDGNRKRPQYGNTRIKDILSTIQKKILPQLIQTAFSFSLVYENTISKYGNNVYKAAFFFSESEDSIISSEGSKKTTMIYLEKDIYLTTLDFMGNKDGIDNFISTFLGLEQREKTPSWIEDFRFGDDNEQQAIIDESKITIEKANEKIILAQRKLDENNRFKSILYTTGDELVQVVFSILEKLLNYDLSEFVDKKAEDFLIKKKEYTLIGEIKGINSNIRNENIAQIDLHCQKYKDKLAEQGKEEKVYQILIMNTFRKTPLAERKEVHDNQIQLAKRNCCLIIETITLLKLYEKYLAGEIDTNTCEKLFTDKTGLLKQNDF